MAKCNLPGLKLMPNEPASVALSRLIHTNLPPLSASITVDRCAASTSEVVVQKFGICTYYERTTWTATVTGDIPAESCVSSLSANDIRRSGVSVDADLFRDNLQREVYFVMGTDKTRLYVWVTAREFDFLCLEANVEFLNQWLESLPQLNASSGVEGVLPANQSQVN